MGGRRRLPRLQPRGELERQRPHALVVLDLHARTGEPLQELTGSRDMGADLQSLDPHLVEAGSLGGDQCGTAGADYLAHCSYNTGPGDRLTGLFG